MGSILDHYSLILASSLPSISSTSASPSSSPDSDSSSSTSSSSFSSSLAPSSSRSLLFPFYASLSKPAALIYSSISMGSSSSFCSKADSALFSSMINYCSCLPSSPNRYLRLNSIISVSYLLLSSAARSRYGFFYSSLRSFQSLAISLVNSDNDKVGNFSANEGFLS